MLVLTVDDYCILESIARGLSHPGEEGETSDQLRNGFSEYGDEEAVAKYPTRDDYFRKISQELIENLPNAGKTFEEAYTDLNLRGIIYRIVKNLGVPDSDSEDVTQEALAKVFRLKLIENYNPTRATLQHYLYRMVQNLVYTWHGRKSRKVEHHAVRLDGLLDDGQTRGTASLYASDDGVGSPEERLDTQEVIARFGCYLDTQKPVSVRRFNGFEFLCTLLPPGTAELPTDQEVTLFYTGGGVYNARVTTWELYGQGVLHKVPCYLLVDYITKHPETGEQLIVVGTDEWARQKYYPNPDYDPNAPLVIEPLSMKQLYLFLRDGKTIDEIARWYKVPPTSVPAWIPRLERCFREFLMIDSAIPNEVRLLAASTYQCPDCKKLFWVRRSKCQCGCDMTSEVAKIRFEEYPWERVHAKRATQERFGTRRAPLTVMRGSLSGHL